MTAPCAPRQRRTPTAPAALVFVVLVALGQVRAGSPGEDPSAPLRPIAAPATPAPAPGDPPVPSVAIRVRVPAESAADRELTYRLIAENCSKASANHVAVRVTLPAGAAKVVRANPTPSETEPILLWKLGTLAACEKREITLVVMPTGPEEIALCARVQFEHGQCVRTRVAKAGPGPAPPTAPDRTPPLSDKPTLQICKTGPTEALLYDYLKYKIEIRNPGRVAIRNVVVRDTLPKGVNFMTAKPPEKTQDPPTWQLAEIAPGNTAVIEYDVVAKETGTLTSVASVEAAGLDRQEGRHTLRVGQPRLAIVKKGPASRGVGRLTTYLLTVSNPGDMPATNVQVVDELVTDKIEANTFEFVGATGGGRHEAGKVRWDLGTLAPGTKRTVQLVIRSRRAGGFVNVCTATADRGLIEQGKAETTFTAADKLAVEIDPDVHPLEVNQVGTIVVRVHNGSRANETNVAAVLTLPEGLKFVALPDVKYEVKGRSIVLPKRNIEAGKDAQVVLRVQAEKAGVHKLGVEVTSDASPTPVKTEEPLTVVPSATTSKKVSSW